MTIIDTNIICRFLLRDHPTLSPKAKEIFTNEEIFLDEVVIAETIWVLFKHYRQSRNRIVSQLTKLLQLPSVTCYRKEVLLNALQLFATINISYIDCWLLSLHQQCHLSITTFDKDLKKHLVS